MWVSGASGRVLVLIKLVFVIPTAPCYATKLNRDERTENETMLHVVVPKVYWSLLSLMVRSGYSVDQKRKRKCVV